MNIGLPEILFILAIIGVLYLIGGMDSVKSVGRIAEKSAKSYVKYEIEKVDAAIKLGERISGAFADEIEENLRRWSKRTNAYSEPHSEPIGSRDNAVIAYFDILDIPIGTSCEGIKQAYRKKAREVHPDHNQEREEWANEQMKKVNEAAEYLLQRCSQ